MTASKKELLDHEEFIKTCPRERLLIHEMHLLRKLLDATNELDCNDKNHVEKYKEFSLFVLQAVFGILESKGFKEFTDDNT